MCSQKYLIEFLEVGGVLTTLEILGAKATKEVLYLLYTISISIDIIYFVSLLPNLNSNRGINHKLCAY